MSSFSLQSIKQNAPATIRVTFTQDPRAINEVAFNDALNPHNWSITGPATNRVTNCGVVYGDPRSIDLFLAATFTAGTWTIIAADAIVASDLTVLSAPSSQQVLVASGSRQTPLNQGAINDPVANVIRKFLNPYLKGDGWDAMVDAIAAGESINWDNAKAAFDQLFTSTASGSYLDRRAADEGIRKPVNIGMSDELFRQYVIRLTNNKLTEESLLELLEIFYGQDSVRAHNLSAAEETYALTDGDDLWLLFDEQTVVAVTFVDDDFADISNATAIEVAIAITNACREAGTTAFAVPYTDPETSLTYVKVYSGSLGLVSSVRVTSGKAQSVLKFADELAVFDAALGWSVTWTIDYDASTGLLRFATDSTNINLALLYEGDYVNIFGSEFDPTNKGSLRVENVHYAYSGVTLDQWFEVSLAGTSEVVVQTNEDAVLYFRPTRNTIHTSREREVIVAQPANNEIDIVIPATSQAVNRAAGRAAYAVLNASYEVTQVTRDINGLVTVTCAGHPFQTGDIVQVD